MAEIIFKGEVVKTVGELPKVGTKAPRFTLTRTDLSELKSEDLRGKKVILNIFPSIDTPVCARSVRTFNSRAGQEPNTLVLCISADLPFAHNRFCAVEDLAHVIPLSDFRHKDFGKIYGVTMLNGFYSDLMSRAVVILDEEGTVIYNEMVADLDCDPDYETALAKVALGNK